MWESVRGVASIGVYKVGVCAGSVIHVHIHISKGYPFTHHSTNVSLYVSAIALILMNLASPPGSHWITVHVHVIVKKLSSQVGTSWCCD